MNSIKMQEYELFKLEWMISHGFTLKDLMSELAVTWENSDWDGDLPSIFMDWEYDSGFGGTIWPCFEEWLECEGAE